MALRPRVTVADAGRSARVMRTPRHPFLVDHFPFVITPFFIAPVLPGETLKTLQLQSRAVSDPIKHPLVGWWLEYYLFYVKLRDLDVRETVTEMVLDPNFDPTPLVTAAGGSAARNDQYYAGGAGQINWVQLCLNRCVTAYFRDEGSSHLDHNITAFSRQFPVAQINGNNVLDSVAKAGDRTALDVEVEGPDANTTIQASEVELAMRKWEALKMSGLTEMTYEDYLSSYGIRPAAVELHRPELIRYVRDWVYPSNTIDPSSGTPRSAVSWAVAERADKDRFFSEPGFLFGVTLARPKVYLRHQLGSFSSALNDMFAWLPKMLHDDYEASWKLIPDAVGPLGGQSSDTGGYWVDIKDLFLHGEQFTSVVTTSTAHNMVPLPSADLNNRFYPPDLASIQELFVDAATVGAFVRQDGVVSLTIAGSLRETSPRGGPLNAT